MLALLVSLILTSASPLQDKANFVEVNGSRLRVDLVRTPAEKARGLMYREKMGDNEGMLFLWASEEPRSFWMKNTYISLDIIFMSKDREVLRVAESTTPLSEAAIPSYYPAQYVLELKAGRAKALKISPGTKIKFLFD